MRHLYRRDDLSTWTPFRCRARPGLWRCRLVTRDDVLGAIKLYGGQVSEFSMPEYCYKFSPPQPPSAVKAVAAPGGSVSLRWRNARDRHLGNVRVVRTRDECAARPAAGTAVDVGQVKGGRPSTATDAGVSGPGRYCYTLWSVDVLGRPSTRPTTLSIEILATKP